MSKLPRGKLTQDNELIALGRICDLLALLNGPGRRRVLSYVMARVDSLPVLAEVGGGESELSDAPLFPQHRNPDNAEAAED
jgi:hypothetical protein